MALVRVLIHLGVVLLQQVKMYLELIILQAAVQVEPTKTAAQPLVDTAVVVLLVHQPQDKIALV